MSLDIFKDPSTAIWIYTENKQLESKHEQITVIQLEHCSIENILKDLYARGVGRLLVEAGPTLTTTFLQTEFINELIIYYAPKLIGGSGHNQFFHTEQVVDLADVPQFEIVNSNLLEQNIKLNCERSEISMFTGIVEEVGTINKISTQQSVVNLTIGCKTILADMHIGDSISVNGACLTVIEFDDHSFSVQVIKGTENKTYLNQLNQAQEVNLERAMSGQGRFGGHFVLGHVDEVAKITRIQASDNSKIVTIKPNNSNLIKQMVQQGSITVDGVSLTIFKLKDTEFDIHLIPETRKSTILNDKRVGDPVHIETDMLFKYVERIMESTDSGLTSDKLKAFGF